MTAMDNKPDLAELRRQIDAVDVEMIKLLAQRERLVHGVLVHKKAAQMPARVPARIEAVLNNAARLAADAGMSPDLARTVWGAMVEWFVQHEEKELERG